MGYQLNYSRDVLALKQDILDGRFGKPIYMKALHAMRRGDKYYARNSWAGHIDVKGCAVNDSPFNNACAHQFQVMTFLLGRVWSARPSWPMYRPNPIKETQMSTISTRLQYWRIRYQVCRCGTAQATPL
ncbi:hypothetical protein NIA69_16875 [Gemmiger formicilis]|nr:hypothetical protein [Gemmiger formicilis]